jgi:hypothetical protein
MSFVHALRKVEGDGEDLDLRRYDLRAGREEASLRVVDDLEDLFVERIIVVERPRIRWTRSATPFVAKTRWAASPMALDSIAWTRDAPASAATVASTPVPVPMSSTTSSVRTRAFRALTKASVRARSFSIATWIGGLAKPRGAASGRLGSTRTPARAS